MAASSLIQFSNLSVTAGSQPLLTACTGTIASGTLTAIAGPSGAGKTTLLRALAGLSRERVDGEVTFQGRPLESYSLRELALKRSYLPQNEQVSGGWRCTEILQLGFSARRGGTSLMALQATGEERARVKETLDMVGLKGMGDRAYATLSGGEKRRLLFARALIQSGECMFLDEPTAFFDPGQSLRFMTLLKEIRGRYDASMVVVTHDLGALLNNFDQLLLLQRGTVVASGPPHEVLKAHGEQVYGVRLQIDHDREWGYFIKSREER